MSPILTGIVASGISGHLTPPYDGPYGVYDSLATVTLSASASSISFAGIPTGYKHLQIRGITQSNYNFPVDDAYLRFNGDSGSNYASHMVQGNGSAASAGSLAPIPATWAQILWGTVGTTSGNQTTASWGPFILDALDYSNINKYKTIRTLSGNDCNGTGNAGLGGRIAFASGLWQNTAPITSIEIICAQGARNFQIYSSFALYGVK